MKTKEQLLAQVESNYANVETAQALKAILEVFVDIRDQNQKMLEKLQDLKAPYAGPG